MLKAICFDLDGVFFTSDSFRNFKKNLPKEINEPTNVDFVLYKSDEMFKFKTGKITENEFWDYATKELKISTDLKGIYKTFIDNYAVNNNVVEYVQKVKKAGYKTCICSNNFPTRIKALDNKWNFLNYFDVKIFSYEVGYTKPAIEIFQSLVKSTNVRANEIAYSDDDESKMEGAKNLGIQTFLYTDFNSFVKNLEDLGVKI